jgi:hypothetical protein
MRFHEDHLDRFHRSQDEEEDAAHVTDVIRAYAGLSQEKKSLSSESVGERTILGVLAKRVTTKYAKRAKGKRRISGVW